jgi:hypothetical protein
MPLPSSQKEEKVNESGKPRYRSSNFSQIQFTFAGQTANPFSNLFGNTGKKEEGNEKSKQDETAYKGIFSQSFLSSSNDLFKTNMTMFSNNNSFPGKSTPFPPFGGSTQSSGSIFSKAPAKGAGESEDEGDSAELIQAQDMKVDPSKSSGNFEYAEQCKILKTAKLSKFKKDKGSLIETPLKALIQFDPEAKSYHILIKSPTTHTVLYSGLLIAKKSECRTIANKPESIEVRAFKFLAKQNQLESHIIKIQINEEDETVSKEFYEQLKQIYEGGADSAEAVGSADKKEE